MGVFSFDQSKDAVAQYPDEWLSFKIKDFKPGYFMIATSLDNPSSPDRYFIHARATLPLKDIESGIGFGLWVEVKKEDFDRYLETDNDDEKYLKFTTEGTLANNWPGFENTLGLKVKLKTVKVDQKVYIWDVEVYDTVDVLFRIALLMQKGDTKKLQDVKDLVKAWMKDFGTPESN